METWQVAVVQDGKLVHLLRHNSQQTARPWCQRDFDKRNDGPRRLLKWQSVRWDWCYEARSDGMLYSLLRIG